MLKSDLHDLDDDDNAFYLFSDDDGDDAPHLSYC